MINILDLLPHGDESNDSNHHKESTIQMSVTPRTEKDLIMSRPLGFKSGKVFRFDLPDSPQSINYVTTDQSIKSATFEKIIEKLTSKTAADSGLLFETLLTYRSHNTPLELIDALIQRFNTANGHDRNVVKIRVINVLKCWIQKFWYDFSKDEILSMILLDYINQLETTPGMEKLGSSLKKAYLKKREAPISGSIVFSNLPPKPIIPSHIGMDGIKLLDIDPEELARQMTLIEQKLFHKIDPWEFLSLNWTKPDRATKSPNILAMTKHFNDVSQWVSSEICRVENFKNRVKIMQRFIDVADKLKQMNNFNGCIEIASGLNSSSVVRLKNTLNALPQKSVTILNNILDLAQRGKSYSRLRKEIHNCSPPCVPYLGMYLMHLAVVEEGSPDICDGGLINCVKKKQIGTIIREMEQYLEKYYFETVPVIKKYLKSLNYFDEETNFRLSCYIEPKTMQRPEKPVELMTTEEISKSEDFMEFDLEYKEGYPFYDKDQPSNIILEDKDGIEMIKAGTIEKIVERLTHEKLLSDTTFTDCFFATFREFVTPRQLLNLLISRYKVPKLNHSVPEVLERYRKFKETPIQLRVFNALKTWVDRYYSDFKYDGNLLDKLEQFVKEQVECNPIFAQLESLIQKQKAGSELLKKQSRILQIDLKSPRSQRSVIDFDPESVARELSLLTFSFYKKIRPSELSYKVWKSSNGYTIAPNLFSFFGFLEKVSFNIELQLQTFHESVLESISVWIEVLNISLKLKNWPIVKVIYQKLEMIRVAELNFIWNKVKYNQLEILNEVKRLFNTIEEIKEKVRMSTYPSIPLLDIALKDLVEGESLPGVLSTDLINFSKYRMTAEIVIPLLNHQRVGYQFESNEQIKQWILREPEPHELHTLNLIERFKHREITSSIPTNPSSIDLSWDKDMILSLIQNNESFKDQISNLVHEVINDKVKLFKEELKEIIQKYDTHSTIIKKLKEIAIKEYKGCKITTWNHNDEKGEIYGCPFKVSINLFLRPQGVYMCDIRKAIDIVDVLNLISIGKFYRSIHKNCQILCVMFACTATEQSISLAKKANIRVVLTNEQTLMSQ